MFMSPRKKHNMLKWVTNLDDFEKDVLRKTIFRFCDKGEFPMAKKFALDLRDKINYSRSVSSMHKILKSIGFKYRKTSKGRKFLMEKGDIMAARIGFLSTVHNFRIAGDERPVFYLDKTWVNQNHSRQYIWHETVHLAGIIKKGRLKSSSRKRQQAYCVPHRTSKTGFIPDSKKLFRSCPQRSDSNYNSEMNADSFKDWFANRFLSYLEEGSIIIMDNASYHSTIAVKVPNTGSH
jgi:hypothetical protein